MDILDRASPLGVLVLSPIIRNDLNCPLLVLNIPQINELAFESLDLPEQARLVVACKLVLLLSELFEFVAEDLKGVAMSIHTVFIVDLIDVFNHFLDIGFDILPDFA